MRASFSQLIRSMTTALVAALAVASVALPALAQQPDDPPGRVGRLSDFAGEVFIAPDDSNADWQPIGLNYPITIGDNIWSGQDSRAEIDFGAGHVRLSRETNAHFSQLDDRQFSAYLASGRAILRLRSLEPGETAKFDTANLQLDIVRPGIYRIEADADGLSSIVVVREGEAQVRTTDGAVTLRTGQTATVTGTGYGSALVVRDGYGTDGFDAWSLDRDARLDGSSPSSQYISSYVPGVRDLDLYGRWDTVPAYGAVWYPTNVSDDWVPYRDGNWTYVRPWGWTWVDSAPWGWAPFHYGRWVRIGPRWAWCPGEYVRRPVYAPALVAWYGGSNGTSWSVNLGGPAYGWVPLAWGEPYWPHHRYSNDYWRIINRPYAVNVQRIPPRPVPGYTYSNMRIGAFTVAPSDALARRRPISTNRIVAPSSAFAGAALTTSPLGVRPVDRPLTADSRPRGAPPPASALIGRTRIDSGGLRAPVDSRVTPRPGITESSPAASAPAPSVGGNRQPVGEPIPPRPATPAAPATNRPQFNETPRSTGREPYPSGAAPLPTPAPSLAPAPNPPTSAPAPMTPAPYQAPSSRPAPPGRISVPDSPPPAQLRQSPREPVFQRPPAPAPQASPPPQSFAPPPQQPMYLPAPQPARPMNVPAPPQAAPAQGFVPAPAPAMRGQLPAAPNASPVGPPQSGRPEPPPAAVLPPAPQQQSR